MSERNRRLERFDLTASALLFTVCSFGAASALASGQFTVARWALVVAAGGCGAVMHRLAGRSVRARERAGFTFGFVAAVAGSALFGSAFLFGTTTNPVEAAVTVRAVACLSFGALVVATIATVTFVGGALRQHESPEERADRIFEQVIGGDGF